MLAEVGHCPGVENYSRHLSGRALYQTPVYDTRFQRVGAEQGAVASYVDESWHALRQGKDLFLSATIDDLTKRASDA